MKTRNLLAALVCSACLTVTSLAPVNVMADTSKIVTLGADLTSDQQNTMLKYFNTSSSQAQIIYVTNADEREYLGNYISSAQIGTRTLSCAYVKPTQSGGIKVRTANLNYVTCNMIASALSTAGVTNCEVVAACPLEVSGTGALTGVMMAYETSTGTELDSAKKDLATKEVVVTGDVGTQIGQDNATNIINQAKLQIIGNNVQNADEIYNIVNNIATENNYTLSDDQMNTIVSLLQQIAQQAYDIQAMQETLEDIQQNLEDSMKAQDGETVATPTPTPETAADDTAAASDDGGDITQDVNTAALQESGPVIESSTEDPNLASDTGYETNTASDDTADTSSDGNGTGIPDAVNDGTGGEGTDETAGETVDGTTTDGTAADETTAEGTTDETTIPEATGDETTSEGTDEAAAEGTTDETTIPEATGDETTSEGTDEAAAEGTADETVSEEPDVTLLSADSQTKYEDAQKFFNGEYKADLATLQEVVPDVYDTSLIPTLDTDTADKLIAELKKDYYDILTQADAGTLETYTADGTESVIYNSNELNVLNKQLKTVFGMFDTVDLTDSDILYNVSLDDRRTLYTDTLNFFTILYGENTEETVSEETAAEETAADEGTVDETAVDTTAIDEANVEEAVY